MAIAAITCPAFPRPRCCRQMPRPSRGGPSGPSGPSGRLIRQPRSHSSWKEHVEDHPSNMGQNWAVFIKFPYQMRSKRALKEKMRSKRAGVNKPPIHVRIDFYESMGVSTFVQENLPVTLIHENFCLWNRTARRHNIWATWPPWFHANTNLKGKIREETTSKYYIYIYSHIYIFMLGKQTTSARHDSPNFFKFLQKGKTLTVVSQLSVGRRATYQLYSQE